MSNKSIQKTAVVSGDTQNAADMNNGRSSTVEVHRHSDASCTVSDYETISVDSQESQIDIWDYSYTPSEMQKLHEAFQKKEEEEENDEEEEDAKQRSENTREESEEDEEEEFNQLYLALERDDKEAVRRLLMSSVDVNELDANKNNIPQLYAIVKELLNKKTIVDPRNAFDTTSLHMAPKSGHLGITHTLLKNKAANSDSCHDPLPIAPEMGCVEIVKSLIEYVGRINEVDENGDTALHLAARNDRNALVKILLNQSTERDARFRLELVANQIHPDELELSQQTKRNQAAVDQIPHHAAIQSGYYEMGKNLLSHHPSLMAGSTREMPPLSSRDIAEREHAEIVENFILDGANVNACNNAKMTPLHLACQNGHRSIVGILLDKNATVDVSKQAQETPFYLAAKNGHADVVNVLLSRGICDFVLTSRDETPLHVAVKEGHTEVADVILKHSCRISGKLANDEQKLQESVKNLDETKGIVPIELTKPDGRRFSAGIVWTERRTPLETMLDVDGHTALELAVKSNQTRMVKILLNADRCVYSERHLRNSFSCMKPGIRYELGLMSKMKCTNTIDIMEFLCYDIQYNMECQSIKEIAQLLLNSSKFKANYQDDQLNTVLHWIITECRECSFDYLTEKIRSRRLRIKTMDDIIQMLLEKGADFNMKNAYGETPLIIASEKGCSHAIQKLFDWEKKSGLKLDLDARNECGATALIKAAEERHVSVMRLLLSHKVSVNLYDHYGFTALHEAVYEPNRNWFDLHFFRHGLLKQKMHQHENFQEIKWDGRTVNLFNAIEWIKSILDYNEKTTRFKEEMVKLLLDIDETNVNAKDFKGNTPLDLAVKSSARITSETFRALKDRGAIRNSLEPMDEAPLEVARIDERGRGPLHRMIISHVSLNANVDMTNAKRQQYWKMFELMAHVIFLKPQNFKESANARDDKGRTPLHYAVIHPSVFYRGHRDLVRMLLDISSVNAVDIYGQTSLHSAACSYYYKLFIQHGADESIKDNYGHTPKGLCQLKEKVIRNINSAREVYVDKDTDAVLEIGYYHLYTFTDIERALRMDHVTELSKRKLVETIRIYSQSPRRVESPEEAIWKIWTRNDFFDLNRLISQLEPSIECFIKRLADGIKERDERFECQPILVGSAYEETKVFFSADFDFNFRLTKFSEKCDMFPHPMGPNGYFQFRRKSDDTERRVSDGEFDCFFNVDKCLLTNEVTSKFQIILEDLLYDPSFWKDEHSFELNLADAIINKSDNPAVMCKTLKLKMIHPIADGECDAPFVDISIDIVVCVHVDESCLGDQLSVDISPAGKAGGCTLIFGRPRFDPFKPLMPQPTLSDTFAKISFAPLESRIIRESLSVIKAAYIVCKRILHKNPKATHQLKTSLLFCMEALKIRDGCERKDEDEITPKELAFWVERLMFCFSEFCRHDVYPCYFMPSFKLQVDGTNKGSNRKKADVSFPSEIPFKYSPAFDIYLDICPDDATIDIPIKQVYNQNTKETIVANPYPMWEQFYKEEFLRKIASRSPSN